MSLPAVPENLENIPKTREYLAVLVADLISSTFLVDGSVPMAGNLDMNGFNIVNLAFPIQANDAATKEYVDSAHGSGGSGGGSGLSEFVETIHTSAPANQLIGNSPTLITGTSTVFTLTKSSTVVRFDGLIHAAPIPAVTTGVVYQGQFGFFINSTYHWRASATVGYDDAFGTPAYNIDPVSYQMYMTLPAGTYTVQLAGQSSTSINVLTQNTVGALYQSICTVAW